MLRRVAARLLGGSHLTSGAGRALSTRGGAGGDGDGAPRSSGDAHPPPAGPAPQRSAAGATLDATWREVGGRGVPTAAEQSCSVHSAQKAPLQRSGAVRRFWRIAARRMPCSPLPTPEPPAPNCTQIFAAGRADGVSLPRIKAHPPPPAPHSPLPPPDSAPPPLNTAQITAAGRADGASLRRSVDTLCHHCLATGSCPPLPALKELLLLARMHDDPDSAVKVCVSHCVAFCAEGGGAVPPALARMHDDPEKAYSAVHGFNKLRVTASDAQQHSTHSTHIAHTAHITHTKSTHKLHAAG